VSKYLDLSIEEINKLLKDKKITPTDLVNEAFDNIEKNEDLKAFITLDKEGALKRAKELEGKKVDNLLFGIPIAIKDNICTEGIMTTAGSHILEGFMPIYDATLITKIKDANMIIIGKTSMDEFAMGSSSRTCYYGAPRNPWNKDKIPGGSSGGSAACVSARLVPLALGSDTGGSIRQPASYTGIVGMKPTYGRVSRYGVIAFASSLDQVGPMTRNVRENAELLNILCGKDERDLTSSDEEVPDFTKEIGKPIKGMKIGVPNFFLSDIVNKEITEKFKDTIKLLEKAGAKVDYIDIHHIDKAVTLYQVISYGEASSNLARFDGVRYGFSKKDAKSVDELYMKTRGEGFGDEVKRRIMVGSYLLSGENAKIYYDKALTIRDDVKKSFKENFEKYDLIIGPTTTTCAYGMDEAMDDPLKSVMDDILVIPVNMAGLPGLSIPIGFNKDHMPIGMQIIGDEFDEVTIYKLASFIEKELNLNLDPRGDKHE